MRRCLIACAVAAAALALPQGAAATAGAGCDSGRSGVVDHHAGAQPAAAPGQRALVRCVMDPHFKLTESNLLVDPRGDVFVGMTAAGGTDVIASRDGGRSWQRQGHTRQEDAGMSWLERDPASGRMFASSEMIGNGRGPDRCVTKNLTTPLGKRITLNPHFPISDAFSYSDDGGRTWTTHKDQLCNSGDWGKTFVGPAATAPVRAALAKRGLENVVYHCMGATIDVTRTCWRSLDGGETFQRLPASAASEFPTLGASRLIGECSATQNPLDVLLHGQLRQPDPHFLMGNGVVAANGIIYMPGNACGLPIVAISRDDGESWTSRPISVARARGWFPHGGTTGYVVPTNGGLPAPQYLQQGFKFVYGEAAMSALYSQQFAIDREGTLYFTWVDPRGDKPMLSVSRDGAETWSDPVVISPPGVRYAATSAIAVDRPGRVAIAYFGTRDGRHYDGFLTTTDDAQSADPRFQSMQVSPGDVLQPNGVGEPTEYLGVDFDPDGTPWASYPRDTCRVRPLVPSRQCDSDLTYTQNRFDGVIARLADPGAR